jgi:hypothetical protein
MIIKITWEAIILFARMGEKRFPKKALTKKLDQKKAPGRPVRRWDDVAKTGCRKDWKKKARSRPKRMQL